MLMLSYSLLIAFVLSKVPTSAAMASKEAAQEALHSMLYPPQQGPHIRDWILTLVKLRDAVYASYWIGASRLPPSSSSLRVALRNTAASESSEDVLNTESELSEDVAFLLPVQYLLMFLLLL